MIGFLSVHCHHPPSISHLPTVSPGARPSLFSCYRWGGLPISQYRPPWARKGPFTLTQGSGMGQSPQGLAEPGEETLSLSLAMSVEPLTLLCPRGSGRTHSHG